jgi:hypothetical protein
MSSLFARFFASPALSPLNSRQSGSNGAGVHLAFGYKSSSSASDNRTVKALYRTKNSRITFEVTGETQKEIFRQISDLQEVFEAYDTCGLCNSTRIVYRTRTVEGNDFFELACLDCSAEMPYGQHKQGGTLFPKQWRQGVRQAG